MFLTDISCGAASTVVKSASPLGFGFAGILKGDPIFFDEAILNLQNTLMSPN